jgi:PAS domain S-box-containing protein
MRCINHRLLVLGGIVAIVAMTSATVRGAHDYTDMCRGAAAADESSLAISGNAPLTHTPLDFFTNYGQYMPRTHCMTADGAPDWLWIGALVLLTSSVIIGYLRIFFFWRRAYLDEQVRDRNKKLMQLAYIFLWCAVCGYAMSLLSFVWPAYRLLAIFLAILNFFTWRFATSLDEFRISLSAKRLERELRETLEQRAIMLEREVESRTAELKRQNTELEATRAEARKLALVAANAGSAVVITDASGMIEWVNDSFVAMTGYSLDEVRGKKPGALLQGSDTDVATVAEVRAAVESGTAIETEILNYTKGGKPYWLRLDIQPVRAPNGDLTNFIAIETDITAAKRVAQELADARDAANSANRAKSEFLANMSHEIRTPLGAIIGFSDLLCRDAKSSEADRDSWVSTIHKSARHLLALINDVLDISKIEANKMEMEILQCSPHSLLVEVASIMRVPASEKRLDLSLKFATPLPENVQTDPTRFKQVLLNLVGNAIKFTESGNVRIIASFERAGQESWLTVNVCDTGIGMTTEQRQRILQPFAQGDSSMTRRFGGSGLGLAISRHICKQLGGSIEIESRSGVGSTFTARIATGDLTNVAMLDGAANEAILQRVQKLPRSREETEKTRIDGARILVADDGASNRKLISLMLRRAGAEVVLVENGAEAIDAALDGSRFDLIFLDMQMPLVDGYTAAKQIRAAGLNSPIAALTAHALKEDRELCLAAGCDDYLSKPIDAETLLSFTRKILDRAAPQIAEVALAPLVSLLPMDDDEFREVVESFVYTALGRMPELRAAAELEDYPQICHSAHTLKGSGGSAGYPDLAEAARILEEHASERRIELIRRDIELIQSLLDRAATAFDHAAAPI